LGDFRDLVLVKITCETSENKIYFAFVLYFYFVFLFVCIIYMSHGENL